MSWTPPPPPSPPGLSLVEAVQRRGVRVKAHRDPHKPSLSSGPGLEQLEVLVDGHGVQDVRDEDPAGRDDRGADPALLPLLLAEHHPQLRRALEDLEGQVLGPRGGVGDDALGLGGLLDGPGAAADLDWLFGCLFGGGGGGGVGWGVRKEKGER